METPEARTLSEESVAELISLVEPTVEFRRATPAERGFCTVYAVDVDTPAGSRSLFLKSSPDGQRWGIPDEARIQSVISANTSIPVPDVVGVVDDHERLPTPTYLMEALSGDELAYEAVAELDDAVLERLATDLGGYLGELHSIPGLDGFGSVRHDDEERVGERPGSEPSALTVGDPYDRWPDFLRAIAEREFGRHADSRFADLTADLHRWFEREVSSLSGPFDPVLGRNDHGLHNLLVDPSTGAVTGVIDWGYTLAVPASYDVEFAVYLFGGAFLAGLPPVTDRRSLVREAMLAGYREAAPERVAAVDAPEPAYELLAMVRIMNDFHHLDVPEEAEAAVVDRIAADARELVD